MQAYPNTQLAQALAKLSHARFDWAAVPKT
jgi:hypothetical protein